MTCPEPLRAPAQRRGCLLGLALCFLSAALFVALVWMFL